MSGGVDTCEWLTLLVVVPLDGRCCEWGLLVERGTKCDTCMTLMSIGGGLRSVGVVAKVLALLTVPTLQCYEGGSLHGVVWQSPHHLDGVVLKWPIVLRFVALTFDVGMRASVAVTLL